VLVDVHNHVIPEPVLQLAAKDTRVGFSVEDGVWRGQHHVPFSLAATFTDPAAKLNDLEARGMWGAVISPAPVLFGYDRTGEVAVAMCAATNQGMADFCDYAPDRYHWLANLPMQDPGDAAGMYAEAVRAGAVGAAIGPAVAVASRTAESPVTGTPAGTVAVRAAGLRVRSDGTVTAEGMAPSAGELAAFCRPVVMALAVVRRDGTVLADGWLPDFVRLGELERHLGDGVIEGLVETAIAEGRLERRQRRRIMSYPLVIRLMLAMALMPDASYCEALARLAGVLADIPFARPWHVPTEKVITQWRRPVPPGLMQALFWEAAGPLIGDDEPSAVLLAGMMVCAADGMLVNLPDTPANRAMFGSTGTADDSAPFPQLRFVAITAHAGRAMLGAIPGSASAGERPC